MYRLFLNVIIFLVLFDAFLNEKKNVILSLILQHKQSLKNRIHSFITIKSLNSLIILTHAEVHILFKINQTRD